MGGTADIPCEQDYPTTELGHTLFLEEKLQLQDFSLAPHFGEIQPVPQPFPPYFPFPGAAGAGGPHGARPRRDGDRRAGRAAGPGRAPGPRQGRGRDSARCGPGAGARAP